MKVVKTKKRLKAKRAKIKVRCRRFLLFVCVSQPHVCEPNVRPACPWPSRIPHLAIFNFACYPISRTYSKCPSRAYPTFVAYPFCLVVVGSLLPFWLSTTVSNPSPPYPSTTVEDASNDDMGDIPPPGILLRTRTCSPVSTHASPDQYAAQPRRVSSRYTCPSF